MYTLTVFYMDKSKENFLACDEYAVDKTALIVKYRTNKQRWYYMPLFNVKRFTVEEIDHDEI